MTTLPPSQGDTEAAGKRSPKSTQPRTSFQAAGLRLRVLWNCYGVKGTKKVTMRRLPARGPLLGSASGGGIGASDEESINNKGAKMSSATVTTASSLFDKRRYIAEPGYNRWLVPPCALAIHLCIGMAYGFSVFWLPLHRAVGHTKPLECPASLGFFGTI